MKIKNYVIEFSTLGNYREIGIGFRLNSPEYKLAYRWDFTIAFWKLTFMVAKRAEKVRNDNVKRGLIK